MSESTAPAAPLVESPPPTPVPAREAVPDPRQQLHKLAHELIRANNRRLLVEYLRLRRSIR
jgi:hypothetical protein